MENPIYVAADETGGVVTVSQNNPEYGWVMFTQDTPHVANGWLTVKTRRARVMGKVEMLEKTYTGGQEIKTGKIVVKEQLTPFTDNEQADRDLKIAGNTGIICSVNGEPIYRRVEYVLDPNAQDTFVQHDNGEEIRQAIAAITPSNKNITPSAQTVEELENVFEM